MRPFGREKSPKEPEVGEWDELRVSDVRLFGDLSCPAAPIESNGFRSLHNLFCVEEVPEQTETVDGVPEA